MLCVLQRMFHASAITLESNRSYIALLMRITLSYFTEGVHIRLKNSLLRVDYKERSKPLL